MKADMMGGEEFQEKKKDLGENAIPLTGRKFEESYTSRRSPKPWRIILHSRNA